MGEWNFLNYAMSNLTGTSGGSASLVQIRAFTWRYIRQLTRNKASIIFLVGWPTFWYILVSHLFFKPDAASAAVLADAKATYAVAFGGFGAFTVALNGFVGSFTSDLSSKRYRKFRSLPIHPHADLIGRFLAGFVLAQISYAFVLFVGFVDGASFTLRGPFSLPIVLLSLFVFCIVGIVVALVISATVPKPEYATTVAMAVLFVTFFVTGFNGANAAFFPGPTWILNYLPNTLTTRVQLHHLVADGSVTFQGLHASRLPSGSEFVLLLVGYAVSFLALGGWILKSLVYRRERGE